MSKIPVFFNFFPIIKCLLLTPKNTNYTKFYTRNHAQSWKSKRFYCPKNDDWQKKNIIKTTDHYKINTFIAPPKIWNIFNDIVWQTIHVLDRFSYTMIAWYDIEFKFNTSGDSLSLTVQQNDTYFIKFTCSAIWVLQCSALSVTKIKLLRYLYYNF